MTNDPLAAPCCARCGATTADRVYLGFADGEVYCTECLSPEQVEMILGLLPGSEDRP